MSSHADPETEENTLLPASTDVDPAVDPVAEEPEPLMPEPVEDALTKFNAAWKIKLDEKRVIEMNVEKEQRAKAAEELSTFSSQRDIKLKAKKESNQNAEKVFVESVTKDLASTQVWDRVTKLIDVNAVEKAEDSSKSDVSRMRKLFIHLKNEPVAAK